MAPERSARTTLEEVARAALAAGVAAVEPRRLVREHLRAHPGLIRSDAPVHVVAVGKAGVTMARGAIDVLGPGRTSGLVVVPEEVASTAVPIEGFDVMGAGHPLPTSGGLRAATAVRDVVASLGAEDVLLLLVSGGGSALLTLPVEDVSLGDLQATTQLLLEGGASIRELNAVRKHLEMLKGGQLARLAAPAEVVALVLSDVVGDPLDVIASGPVSADTTSFLDAHSVLEARGGGRVPRSVRDFVQRGVEGLVPENPAPGDACFERVTATVIGNNELAARAAAEAARGLGFSVEVVTTAATGEARDLGRELGRLARQIRAGSRRPAPPACLVVAGETTVSVRGTGLGGRNQEVALAAALEISGVDGVLVATMGTDGIDGPTGAAGAIATGETLARAAALGVSAEAALAANDSHSFFSQVGDLIVTGPTGTNVMDLCVVVAE